MALDAVLGGTLGVRRRDLPTARMPEFEALARHERPALLALAYALCADRFAAEDLVQEALLEAFRRWDRLVTYDDPSAWLRRVVVTRATSRWRRLRNEARALGRLAARPAPGATSSPDHDFWSAVRGLSPRQAQMICLRYVDDLTIEEISRVMRCADGTVKATLHQARRLLSTRLELEDGDDA